MKEAVREAFNTMEQGFGGPFGAMITDKDGNIIEEEIEGWCFDGYLSS